MNTPSPSKWEHALEGYFDINTEALRSALQTKHIQLLLPYLSPNSTIVEAGCGYGKWVYAFRAVGHRCIGLDFSFGLVSKAREYGSETELHAPSDWIQGDIRALPLDNHSIGCYLSFGVLEHFTRLEQKQILAEVARTLQDGGLLYLYVPYYWSLYTLRRELAYRYRTLFPPKAIWQKHLRRKELIDLCTAAGFETQHIQSVYAEVALRQALYPPFRTAQLLPRFLRHSATKMLSVIAEFLNHHDMMGYALVYIGRKQN